MINEIVWMIGWITVSSTTRVKEMYDKLDPAHPDQYTQAIHEWPEWEQDMLRYFLRVGSEVWHGRAKPYSGRHYFRIAKKS